jgi:hypothetical protein
LVTWQIASSMFQVLSSGPSARNSPGFARITLRGIASSALVCAGFATLAGYWRNSDGRRSRRGRPPSACGLLLQPASGTSSALNAPMTLRPSTSFGSGQAPVEVIPAAGQLPARQDASVFAGTAVAEDRRVIPIATSFTVPFVAQHRRKEAGVAQETCQPEDAPTNRIAVLMVTQDGWTDGCNPLRCWYARRTCNRRRAARSAASP